MRFTRRWQIASAIVAALLVAGVAVAVTRGGSDDTLRTAAPTSTTIVDTTTSIAETSTTVGASIATTTTRRSNNGVATTIAAPPVTAAPARCSQPQPGSKFAAFGATEIVIDNGTAYRSCVLTADTPAQQERGLMNADDLDGYDGMIFRFPDEKERAFWMRNTRVPLSIAFFSANGGFVSSVDMAPCGDSPDCPNYYSHGASKYALEVLQGRLPGLGATAGSRLRT